MVKEIFSNMLETAQERIKSPLYGSFVFAWVILNWKAVSIYVFADIPMEVKVELVQSYTDLYRAALLPLLISILYIFALPEILLWIDKKTFKTWRERKKKVFERELAKVEDKDEWKTKESRLKLKLANVENIEQLKSALTSAEEKLKLREDEIKSLAEKLEKKESEYAELDKKLKGQLVQFNKLKKELDNRNDSSTRLSVPIGEFDRLKGKRIFKDFVDQAENIMAYNRWKHETPKRLCNTLIALELVEENRDDQGGPSYVKLTHKGETVYKRHLLEEADQLDKDEDYEAPKPEEEDDLPF